MGNQLLVCCVLLALNDSLSNRNRDTNMPSVGDGMHP